MDLNQSHGVVVDAWVVSVALGGYTALLIPFVRWLGATAVRAAYDKLQAIEAESQAQRVLVGALNERLGEHGRKLAVVETTLMSIRSLTLTTDDKLRHAEQQLVGIMTRLDRAEEDVQKLGSG